MECHTLRNGFMLRKSGYSTKKRAAQALSRMAKKYDLDRSGFNIYKCSICKRYHFGHKPREQCDG